MNKEWQIRRTVGSLLFVSVTLFASQLLDGWLAWLALAASFAFGVLIWAHQCLFEYERGYADGMHKGIADVADLVEKHLVKPNL